MLHALTAAPGVLQASRRKQVQQLQRQSSAHVMTEQPKQPAHRLVDRQHRATRPLTPTEAYDANLVCALTEGGPVLCLA